MWRRLPPFKPLTSLLSLLTKTSAYSHPPPPTPLHSFLSPSLFSPKTTPSIPLKPPPPPPPDKQTLETTLKSSLLSNQTDLSWRTFKTLISHSLYPSQTLTHSLLSHLLSSNAPHNIKRCFASALLLLRTSPSSLSPQTLKPLFASLSSPTPAFALLDSMFKNQFFVPFSVWGPPVIDLAAKARRFDEFLKLFKENCRVCLERNLRFMRPDPEAFVAALEMCCRGLGSVSEAEGIVATMSAMRVRMGVNGFRCLAYLYASAGMDARVAELEESMERFGFSARKGTLFENLVRGFVKRGSLDAALETVLRAVREGALFEGEEAFEEMVSGFVGAGRVKDLAVLIESAADEESIGFRITRACVRLGMLDRAHAVLDEMHARGCPINVGVYASIIDAYVLERRTAEAAHLVSEIASRGLRLPRITLDSLVDASMSAQDFKSAFSVFRDMRESLSEEELKPGYLTIMTGLAENRRPELMSAFLDEVHADHRLGIATHDWNSIVHAFCKNGRLEDAKRTHKRMVTLGFAPNNQTYLSLIGGYVSVEKYFDVLLLWTEARKRGFLTTVKLDHDLVDAFLYGLVKGGFFDAVMQVVQMAQEMKVFVDKWKHRQAFMEKHKSLNLNKLRRKSARRVEAVIAFKNWVGLNV